jgi:hypothetical protein
VLPSLQVHVTLSGLPLSGSPFDVTVIPGAMCFRKCKLERSAYRAVCGHNSFLFRLRDRHSNLCDHGGFAIAARLADADGRRLPAQVTDRGDGSYEVTYEVTRAGSYRLQLVLNDDEIWSAPKPLELVAARASAVRSSVMERCDGEGSAFRVQTLDRWGNLACAADGADAGDAPCVHVEYIPLKAMKKSPKPKHGERQTLPATALRVKHVGDGIWAADWQAPVPGTYTASVTIDGEHVQGSPLAVTLMPGETCVEACELVETLHNFHHCRRVCTLRDLPDLGIL